MLFNSIEFALFLPLVFGLYWFVTQKNLKVQNTLLLVASYVFYGWWDWRFLSLIIFSSIVDYMVGVKLGKTDNPSQRKLLLWISILINIGFLGFFKYFNFFAESFAEAFTLFGQPFEATRLNVILPVGISFYTFQTLSYSIDVYKRRLEPTKDVVAFFAFVSFFPQLVAGPIERASNLLPQFYKKRKFDYYQAADGMRQILWGLFKKIVIADSCAMYVNDIFANHELLSGSTLFLGGVLFAFQIYGDFSGYSDIAIGTARLFGFNLMQNFAFPYFSRDIAEFWRRWHISLSTWFRDYLYVPLGGSRGGTWMKIRNTFIIFTVSGFWHGANWTFIIWGLINAIYFLPLMLLKLNRKNTDFSDQNRLFPPIGDFFKIPLTFVLTVVAWIFFRAESVAQAFDYLGRMFTTSLFSKPQLIDTDLIILLLLIVLFQSIEWLQRDRQHALELKPGFSVRPLRWALYLSVIYLILAFGVFEKTEFIYFAF